MGVMGTIVGFGAGYALGANRQSAPVQRMEGRVRDAVVRRLPVPVRPVASAETRQVRELMTALPQTVSSDAAITDAARMMADGGFGDVIVVEQDSDRVVGILTDRDIAIRAVAEGLGPMTEVGEVCSRDLVALGPTATVAHALKLMRDLNVRRLPVIEDDVALGIISLGDLSNESGAAPALADISAASPDH